jgi:hypothetical protein
MRFFFLSALVDIVKDRFEDRYDRQTRISFNQKMIDIIKSNPDMILPQHHFRSKYSQLMALLYFHSGYQTTLEIKDSKIKMFDKLITELIIPLS